jgi:hypothetical protein
MKRVHILLLQYTKQQTDMKKLALLFALGLISNFSQAQAIENSEKSNAWGWEDNDNSKKEIAVSVPVLEFQNKNQFDSIRFSVHLGAYKYKVYHYDSLEAIDNVEIFSDFPRISSDDYLEIRRYALVDQNGKLLQMIHIDSNL